MWAIHPEPGCREIPKHCISTFQKESCRASSMHVCSSRNTKSVKYPHNKRKDSYNIEDELH